MYCDFSRWTLAFGQPSATHPQQLQRWCDREACLGQCISLVGVILVPPPGGGKALPGGTHPLCLTPGPHGAGLSIVAAKCAFSCRRGPLEFPAILKGARSGRISVRRGSQATSLSRSSKWTVIFDQTLVLQCRDHHSKHQGRYNAAIQRAQVMARKRYTASNGPPPQTHMVQDRFGHVCTIQTQIYILASITYSKYMWFCKMLPKKM